jgi:SAM-dependent methyltransferase
LKEKEKAIIEENIALHKFESSFYVIKHPEVFNLFEQKRLKEECKVIFSYLRGNKNTRLFCLDIASGTGNLAYHLIHAGFEVFVCDLSRQMLKQNPSKNKVICEAGYLPFQENSFDMISTYSVFHHLPNTKKTVEEICRVSAESSILYFDHDNFLSIKEEQNRLSRSLSYILWLLINPRFWGRFFEFLLWGRKKMNIDFTHINFKLTDMNPVNTRKTIETLKENHFIVAIKNYGVGSQIIARRS